MSDKEYLESKEREGVCPNYLWYLISSFGITVFIILCLLAYLIMYSDHFIWALRRHSKPKIKKSKSKSKSKSKRRKRSSFQGDSTTMKGTKTADESQMSIHKTENLTTT